MDDKAAFLCEILLDPMNGFLQMLQSKPLRKAPTQEVFVSILQVLNKILTEDKYLLLKILQTLMKRNRQRSQSRCQETPVET